MMHVAPVRESRLSGSFLVLVLFAICPLGNPAAGGEIDAVTTVRLIVDAACDASAADLDAIAAAVPQTRQVDMAPLVARDGVAIGWKARFAMAHGAEILIERFAPGGQLRRLVVEYHVTGPNARPRPMLVAVADTACAIRAGRRLAYGTDSRQPESIELLNTNLEPTGEYESLDPPVPPGIDPGGPTVAIVDSGVNYLLPEIAERLARDEYGNILGYDYWDMDPRPFDANPAVSPFFPQRHGTRTASLLVREAPLARLVPYRYPRPDMSRMAALIDDAADKGVIVMNLSMGSNRPEDWRGFATAARDNPKMLFVLSAGNDDRDIDQFPVFPASLALDNTLTVTSSEDNGDLAPGSNRGAQGVDLLVPAERLVVTDFDGSDTLASGSSYAAVRVTALAARFLAAHPHWRASELKAAILDRALPYPETTAAGAGFIPRPDRAERLPPMSHDGPLVIVESTVLVASDAGPDAQGAVTHVLKPVFAYFQGTEWTRERLARDARRVAQIFAQCGVSVPKIAVHSLAGPAAFHYFHDSISRELVRRLALPKPTVYFVRDTLQSVAFDAEAIGHGNSATRPELRDTVWVTEKITDSDIAVAHELAHVLMDSGSHVDLQANLMRARTAPENTRLTARQCDKIIQNATENGLLPRD